MGKIASIDRGWLQNTAVAIPRMRHVGKIASIDRGWLLVERDGQVVGFARGKNSLD